MGIAERKDDFIRLLLRHERPIYAYIRSLVPALEDAEDILQEVSTVLWRKFDSFEPETNFLAWALQIAWHEVQYFRRRQSRDRLRFGDEFLARLAVAAERECPRVSDIQHALGECVSQLGEEARHLLIHRYEPGISVENIARELGRPLQTVYSMLKRIRRVVFECVQRKLGAEETT